MQRPSCRLFVIPAFAAPAAVILRRGPSAWYHVIHWDMQKDVFSHGAWLRGRIYEEKCDLSPDGQLLLYSVYKTIRLGENIYSCYTALSRSPWLRALVVWPQTTTYGGGGRFVGPRRLSLSGYESDPHPKLPRGLTIDSKVYLPPRSSTNEMEGAQWSGRDHKDRLIYTVGGCLFRGVGRRAKQVADFSDLVPKPQPPPEWAGKPLVSSQ